MWCNQLFALIKDNVVQTIIVCDNYHEANRLASCIYGEGAFAVDTTYYPLNIGDVYENGAFYRIMEDGSRREIPRNPTESENIAYLMDENAYLTEIALDADLRMTKAESLSSQAFMSERSVETQGSEHTYWLCYKVIERRIRVGRVTDEWKQDMLANLGVFLAGGRLTDEDYAELSGLVNDTIKK